jgi:probable phosphoglycerate mutase
MTITRLCIVRHGETDWNIEKRLQGQLDVALNAQGRAQARALCRTLSEQQNAAGNAADNAAGHAAGNAGIGHAKFAAVYSSDLARAWQTAQIASAGLPIAVLPAPTFRERHYGTHQGLTSQEAAQAHPAMYRLHQARDLHYDYETGESLARFAARIEKGLQTLAERHRGQSILIFTHGGVLDIIYRLVTQRPLNTPRDFPIPNAAINWLSHSEAGWRITCWGNQSHLGQTLDELR